MPTIRVVQNVMAGRFGRQSLWGSLRAFLVPTHGALSEAYALLDRVGIGGCIRAVAAARKEGGKRNDDDFHGSQGPW